MKVRLTNISPTHQALHRFPDGPVEAELQPRGGMGSVLLFVNKDGRHICLNTLELWGSGIKLEEIDIEKVD